MAVLELEAAAGGGSHKSGVADLVAGDEARGLGSFDLSIHGADRNSEAAGEISRANLELVAGVSGPSALLFVA